MIAPLGMNNSAMGVDRIKGPRHNNGMNNTSFTGLNMGKAQESAQGIFKKAAEFVGGLVQKAKDFFASEGFQKAKENVINTVKGWIEKVQDLFKSAQAKAGETAEGMEDFVEDIVQ